MTASYLVAANVLLQTRLLRHLVGTGPDVLLEYESAYSWWPGRAHFSGLRLRVQDYNVQFEVHASGVVDVSLHELFRRRFRAVRLSTTDTTFRMRHKVHAVGPHNQLRLAAYPPISGFEDPPLYAGPEPPSIPDAEYKLWGVALENVSADLSEIWVLEYRYLGQAHAAGSFQLAPARWFQVGPATLELSEGALSLADRALAKGLKLNLRAEVERTEVAASSGLEPLKSISAKLDVSSRELELAALDLYLKPNSAISAGGPSLIFVSASVTAGQVDVGSRAELQLQGLSLSTRHGRFSGDLASSAQALPTGIVEWVTSSPRVRLENASDHKGPELESPKLQVQAVASNLTAPATLQRVELELPSLSIPSLGWFNSVLHGSGIVLDLGGRLDGQLRVAREVPESFAAQLKLRLLGGTLESKAVSAKLAGHVDVDLEPSHSDNASVGRVDVDLDGVEVINGSKRTAPFRAALRTTDLRVVTHPELQVSGHLHVDAAPADTLLSLWLSPLLKGLAASVLELKRLDANAQFSIGKGAARVELSRAQSGALNGKGYWQQPAQGESQGAFLIRTKVANAGLEVNGSETETTLFVSDDWLPPDWAAPRTAQPPREKQGP
jgi:hypothetical protein